MNMDGAVSAHYSQGNLLSRLRAALREDGADPDRPTPDALAPYDHFHGRGLEATLETARLMPVRANDRILDIGSGLGGPARYVANRFRCHVTGLDLTPEFCEVARQLTALLKLEDRTSFEVGDALAMPFAAASFDGAYSMNVSMNIEDRTTMYREMDRVLKPGGWLVLATPNLDDRIFRAAYVLARGRRPPLFEPDERELHLFHFSARTLRELVTAAGLEVVEVGFDRGAAATWGKRLVNGIACGWFRLTGLNWGMALELIALKPGRPRGGAEA